MLKTVVMQGMNQHGTALYRSVRGEEEAVWGLPEQLLATVVDAVQVGNWQFAAANSKRKPPAPTPLPRPGVGRKKPKKAAGIPLSQAKKYLAVVHDEPE
jgi:hypothetical protein